MNGLGDMPNVPYRERAIRAAYRRHLLRMSDGVWTNEALAKYGRWLRERIQSC